MLYLRQSRYSALFFLIVFMFFLFFERKIVKIYLSDAFIFFVKKNVFKKTKIDLIFSFFLGMNVCSEWRICLHIF